MDMDAVPLTIDDAIITIAETLTFNVAPGVRLVIGGDRDALAWLIHTVQVDRRLWFRAEFQKDGG